MRNCISIFLFVSLLVTLPAIAKQPVVGKKAAEQYFQQRDPANQDFPPQDEYVPTAAVGSHYLAIHAGKYMSSQAYEWGESGKKEDTGDFTAGFTYKFDEWGALSDVNLRIDFNEYKVLNMRPLKMSLMPLITFPESNSKFPIYFGAGAGVGVFFRQLPEETPVTFDYQLVVGARFFNVFEGTGFFIETGMKNHLQILTSGQYNGTFLAGGALFTF